MRRESQRVPGNHITVELALPNLIVKKETSRERQSSWRRGFAARSDLAPGMDGGRVHTRISRHFVSLRYILTHW